VVTLLAMPSGLAHVVTLLAMPSGLAHVVTLLAVPVRRLGGGA
jgi:hypothetical protein